MTPKQLRDDLWKRATPAQRGFATELAKLIESCAAGGGPASATFVHHVLRFASEYLEREAKPGLMSEAIAEAVVMRQFDDYLGE